MKNKSTSYQKLFSSLIPKEFPEVYDLKVWTRKSGVFSVVYIIDVYIRPNVDINCEEFVIHVAAKVYSISKYIEATDRFDVRIKDSNFDEICRDDTYRRTSDTGPF